MITTIFIKRLTHLLIFFIRQKLILKKKIIKYKNKELSVFFSLIPNLFHGT